MRAEDEKARIDRARGAITKLAGGRPVGMAELFDGPISEWQLRLLKRLQRENMVSTHQHGFHANSIRMVALLKAAAANTPAVVELLWPERAKDVLKNLTRLAPEPMPEPEPPPPEMASVLETEATRFELVVELFLEEIPLEFRKWLRVKDLLPCLEEARLAEAFFPDAKNINDQWIELGRLLSSGSRRLQVVDGWIVERRTGQSGTEYRLNRQAGEVPVMVPEPEPVPTPAPVTVAVPVEPAVVVALREHGPMSKRDLQDRLGGKRQLAVDAIEAALEEGLCFFGAIPGHARARVYLQEHADAARVAEEAAVATATTDEQEAGAVDDDTVDDDTFKGTTLKYLVIYGQNFMTMAEHFRVLHETTARLEAKLDALVERLEKP